MKLPSYTSAMLFPITDEELHTRKRFVEEYMWDYNPVMALVRLGQPYNMAVKIAELYLQDNWVQYFLQRERETFFTRLANGDPKVMGMAASKLYEEACTSPKGSARITAWNKIGDLLKMEGAKVNQVGDKPEMTLEETQQELIRRGLPIDILDDKFSTFEPE